MLAGGNLRSRHTSFGAYVAGEACIHGLGADGDAIQRAVAILTVVAFATLLAKHGLGAQFVAIQCAVAILTVVAFVALLVTYEPGWIILCRSDMRRVPGAFVLYHVRGS